MIILGLTGSIGMGKSTVANLLREMGIPVHASDEAVHKLLGRGGKAVAAVRKMFPQAYSKDTQAIDRAALGHIVFDNATKRKKLEKILHPLVQEAQQDFIKANKKHPLVVLDIPLLFETGAQKRVDAVMVVSAPYRVQKQRVLARPHMNYKRFRSILALQMPDVIKRKRADIVIPTDGSIAQTRRRLLRVLRTVIMQ